MALENDFVTPQHPLPKEIQEMKRDETVCQFCGVSYLIHNEIKKLEDEVVKLKKELERCKDFDKREAELKLKLKEENERYAKSQEELREAKIKQVSSQSLNYHGSFLLIMLLNTTLSALFPLLGCNSTFL